MTLKAGLLRSKMQKSSLAFMLGLMFSSAALAQGIQDVSQIVAKVDPAVVMISVDKHTLGSGFVIEKSGLIATNYHVIEGARNATVTFPADKDKKTYPVTGFLAIQPGKDLALIRIRSEDGSFAVLKLADAPPAKGEKVFAFGSPLGLSGSVSDGLVSSLRSGIELQEILQGMTHSNIYIDTMNYDTDAEWIQITAPISPGNSGGPLVNARGEVVGVNTWVFGGSLGQNLNFSLSVTSLRKLVAGAGTVLQPLANLPATRDKGVFGGRLVGDPDKTLAMWKQYNQLKNDLNTKVDACEKKLDSITPLNPQNLNQGLSSRLKRTADIADQMSTIYADYTSRMKALDNIDVDADLLKFVIVETELGQRLSDAYKNYSKKLSRSDPSTYRVEFDLSSLNGDSNHMRTEYNLLRLKLSQKYKLKFPTMEEIKYADDKSADTGAKKTVSPGARKTAAPADRKPNPAASDAGDRSELRTWTDRSGKYQIQAKFLGIDNGKAKLQKTDGKLVLVPVESLSEADRRFIGAAE
jgi:S1-C subfamily serine protease